jgi:hypothetical protein
MAEKRIKPRIGARLQILYGSEDPLKAGVTENISEEGLFIRGTMLHPCGSYLKIQLELPSQGDVVLLGKVRWLRKSPPVLARIGQAGGMGVKIVRFLSGPAGYVALCKRLKDSKPADPTDLPGVQS